MGKVDEIDGYRVASERSVVGEALSVRLTALFMCASIEMKHGVATVSGVK